MKKILLITILGLLLSFNSSKAQIRYKTDNVEISPILIGTIAGGAFILMGALQQPDEKWIQSSSGTYYNMGERGYWRNETFWEDKNRVAAVLSGVGLIGLSVAITIK